MNFEKWKKAQKVAVFGGVFLFGLILGLSTKTRTVEVEKIVEKPVEKIVEKEVIREVCTRDDLWRDLKDIDDSTFMVAAEGFSIANDMLEATAYGDEVKLTRKTAEMEDKVLEMEIIGDKRNTVLEKLGY